MIPSNETPKVQLPGLLHKLGKMTSIRDTALLERSLLKTLCPMLGVLDSSLYRIDDLASSTRILHHHLSRVVEADGMARLVERTEEIFNSSSIAPDVRQLLDNVRLLAKACTRKRDQSSDLLIAYPLFGGREICGYFVFSRDREVTLTEDAIIKGVLEVFANYYDLLDASQRDFPQVGQVTISVGFSEASANDLPQQVLSWADRALYQAKRAGRNRVCDYQRLLRSGEVEAAAYGDSELF